MTTPDSIGGSEAVTPPLTSSSGMEGVGRCGSCRFSTHLSGGRYGAESLCCHRFPPSIHRKWFRLVELYPDVHAGATCGEHQPAKAPSL